MWRNLNSSVRFENKKGKQKQKIKRIKEKGMAYWAQSHVFGPPPNAICAAQTSCVRASTRHPVVWDPLVGFDRARNVGEVPTGGPRLTVSQTPGFAATHVCGLPVGPPGHHPSLRHANPNELRRSRVISSPISLAADSGSPELLGISSAHAAPFFPPTLRLFRSHGDKQRS